MANEIAKLNEEEENLKAHMDQLCEAVSKMKLMRKNRKPFSATAITSDSKMKFYTGRKVFNSRTFHFEIVPKSIMSMIKIEYQQKPTTGAVHKANVAVSVVWTSKTYTRAFKKAVS